MKGIETGKDKVKKICDVLRRETLEPARKEADVILEKARLDAESILLEAAKRVEILEKEAREEIERQKMIFQSSLNQACKQGLESLKQSIEEKLFSEELSKLLLKPLQDPKVLSQLIDAVIRAIDKEGMNAVLSIYIPAAVPARSVNQMLCASALERLKEKSVLVGSMSGGIAVKLHKENVTIEITDIALKEVVANYIRKDFRELIFAK